MFETNDTGPRQSSCKYIMYTAAMILQGIIFPSFKKFSICIGALLLVLHGQIFAEQPISPGLNVESGIGITPSEATQQIAEDYLDVNTEDHGADQISCNDTECTPIFFDQNTIDQRLGDLLEADTARILVEFPDRKYQIDDEKLADVMGYLRAVAHRDGQVAIEPVFYKTRSAGENAISLPLIGDLLQVGYDLFTRSYHYFKYSETRNYHAKLLYSPVDHSVAYIYFVHRSYGDVCQILYSRCDVIEYLDDEIFDKTLSRRLEAARLNGRSVKIVFHNTSAHLPRFELSLDRLKKTNSSLRLYKWFVASAQTEKRQVSKERFLSLQVAVAAIKYSVQVYDMIQTAIMYAPARQMKAQVIYEGKSEGGPIRTVIFSPSRESN